MPGGVFGVLGGPSVPRSPPKSPLILCFPAGGGRVRRESMGGDGGGFWGLPWPWGGFGVLTHFWGGIWGVPDLWVSDLGVWGLGSPIYGVRFGVSPPINGVKFGRFGILGVPQFVG